MLTREYISIHVQLKTAQQNIDHWPSLLAYNSPVYTFVNMYNTLYIIVRTEGHGELKLHYQKQSNVHIDMIHVRDAFVHI